MSTFQTSQYKNIMIISNVNIKFDNHSSIPQCLHLGKQMTTIFCRNLFISDHALRYYCYQQARPPRKIICITDTPHTTSKVIIIVGACNSISSGNFNVSAKYITHYRHDTIIICTSKYVGRGLETSTSWHIVAIGRG